VPGRPTTLPGMTDSLRVLSPMDLAGRLMAPSSGPNPAYYAMYSAAWNGIVTDPRLMLVPVDDHLVHRGDGVFETLKCVGGRIFLAAEHVTRLFRSDAAIGLQPPWTPEDVLDRMVQTVRAGRQRDCLVRILLSRGPGSFGVNPYDCPRPGLYVIAHALSPSFMTSHPAGARVRTSAIPVKAGLLATVKSCNYLPNALMKKEAVDAGVDFTVNLDEHGFLGEGGTENIGLLTRAGALRVPKTGRILPGTTMLRVLELARRHLLGSALQQVEHADLTAADLAQAAEAFIFGTTPDVTAVVEFDGRAIGDGKPGPVWRQLSELLAHDIRDGGGPHVSIDTL
jgi:branched-subunit amino acid aminotransferase/4-amino-4-deoxychorismate lyase